MLPTRKGERREGRENEKAESSMEGKEEEKRRGKKDIFTDRCKKWGCAPLKIVRGSQNDYTRTRGMGEPALHKAAQETSRGHRCQRPSNTASCLSPQKQREEGELISKVNMKKLLRPNFSPNTASVYQLPPLHRERHCPGL